MKTPIQILEDLVTAKKKGVDNQSAWLDAFEIIKEVQDRRMALFRAANRPGKTLTTLREVEKQI